MAIQCSKCKVRTSTYAWQKQLKSAIVNCEQQRLQLDWVNEQVSKWLIDRSTFLVYYIIYVLMLLCGVSFEFQFLYTPSFVTDDRYYGQPSQSLVFLFLIFCGNTSFTALTHSVFVSASAIILAMPIAFVLGWLSFFDQLHMISHSFQQLWVECVVNEGQEKAARTNEHN